MAFYGVQSAGISINGTTADDSIQLLGASTAVVSGDYILGLEGNDLIYFGAEGRTSVASATFSGIASGAASGNLIVTLAQSAGNSTGANVDLKTVSGIASGSTILVSGVVTSQRAARIIDASTINGNAGNDRIYLGSEFTTLSSTTLGGGAGNDTIGNYSFINGALTSTAGTATTIANSFVEGGGGNDTIMFLSQATITGTTVQGGQGVDSISFTTTGASVGTVVNSLFAGGGGNDTITGSFSDAAASAVTVAGGGGNDSVFLEFADDATNILVATDTFNTLGTWDGADQLTAQFDSAFSGVTIQAGAGNDVINVTGNFSEGANRFDLAAGNDIFSATELSSDSIFAGGGNDTVAIQSAAISGYIALGGGNDTLIISGNIQAAAYANASVIGGAGADALFSGDATELDKSGTINPTLIYSAYSDSTLSAMDTVVAVTNAFSGTTKFSFTPGGLSLASFTAAGVSGTNGIATFSGFDTDLTSRVNAIDAAATTVGSTVSFAGSDGTTFLFVQGGTTDLLIQNGMSGSGVGSITLSDGTNVTLENS